MFIIRYKFSLYVPWVFKILQNKFHELLLVEGNEIISGLMFNIIPLKTQLFQKGGLGDRESIDFVGNGNTENHEVQHNPLDPTVGHSGCLRS